MKKIALIIALMAANPAYAQADECERLGQMAESIMMVRQTEIPLSKYIEIAKKYGESEEYMAIMRMAYRIPKVHGADLMTAIAKQFGMSYRLDCMEGLR